jgi:hypothetical protein
VNAAGYGALVATAVVARGMALGVKVVRRESA